MKAHLVFILNDAITILLENIHYGHLFIASGGKQFMAVCSKNNIGRYLKLVVTLNSIKKGTAAVCKSLLHISAIVLKTICIHKLYHRNYFVDSNFDSSIVFNKRARNMSVHKRSKVSLTKLPS